MEAAIEFIKQNGAKAGVISFVIFAVCLATGFFNLIKAVKAKMGTADNNPLDGRRYDDDPDKLTKKGVVFLSQSSLFFSIGFAFIVASSFMGGGISMLGSEKVKDINNVGLTRLTYALERHKPVSYIKQLINGGEDIHVRDKNGLTPLMYAAAWTDPETIELMLNSGARMEDKSNSGDTAVFYAIKWRKPENVKYLAEHGADMNVPGYAEYTPLVAALHDWHSLQRGKAQRDAEISNGTLKLRAKNLRSSDNYYNNTIRNSSDIIHYIVSLNVNVLLPDCHRQTALGLAVGTEFEEEINMLAARQNPGGSVSSDIPQNQ